MGGSGNDLVYGGPGSTPSSGARGNDTAALGAGPDSFTWLPGEGSDVIDGGGGTDSLVFDGSAGAEIMSLSADGDRSVFLRDLGNIRMDMDDVEILDLAALGGADTVTINDMSGTGFRNANIDLSAAGVGDAAADLRDGERLGAVRAHPGHCRPALRLTSMASARTRTSLAARPPTSSRSTAGAATTRLRVGRGVTALIGVPSISAPVSSDDPALSGASLQGRPRSGVGGDGP